MCCHHNGLLSNNKAIFGSVVLCLFFVTISNCYRTCYDFCILGFFFLLQVNNQNLDQVCNCRRHHYNHSNNSQNNNNNNKINPPFSEEFLQQRQIGRSLRHLVLNLSEQMIVQEDAKNTPSLFELTISSDEKSAHIVAGETAQVTLTIGLSSGNTQNVTLSCNLTPPSSEGTVTLAHPWLLSVGNATLRISTKDTILPGQYTATITATPERGANRTTNLKVVVDAKLGHHCTSNKATFLANPCQCLRSFRCSSSIPSICN